jgi:hypothetical protein
MALRKKMAYARSQKKGFCFLLIPSLFFYAGWLAEKMKLFNSIRPLSNE